jgi:uncharacterized RDD family membrane protein YckC
MSESRNALIVANSRYDYPGLQQLLAPAQDAESLARVLANPAIGGFQVRTIVNQPSYQVRLEIENFCENGKLDDLLLLYFSCHGIKDSDGRLYFAVIDTQMAQTAGAAARLRVATAISSEFVNEMMNRSRSRRQILLLDCCYSGAFKEGMLAKGDNAVGAGEQLQGKGRIVLTASDAIQYSFEAEGVKGEGTRSVFTSALVRGLETGLADLDHDGSYDLDEVYDYLHSAVPAQQPDQKPMKMGYVEGKIFIGSNPRPTAARLPEELRETLDDRRPWVRLGAVSELEKFLASPNKGLSLAADAALQSLASRDDSNEVRQTAAQCRLRHRGPGAGEPQQAVPPAPQPTVPSEPRQAVTPPVTLEREGPYVRQRETTPSLHPAPPPVKPRMVPQTRPAAAPPLPSPAGIVSVGPGRRAAADLIDWAVTIGLVLIPISVSPNMPNDTLQTVLGWYATFLCLPCAFLVAKTGKTVGRQLTGTSIVDAQGNRLTFLRSLAFCLAWIFLAPLPLPGLGTALFVHYSRRHAALYDLVAGTSARRD